MSGALSEPDPATRADIDEVLQEYFDGLYHSDTARLSRVFHPGAVYATATDGSLTRLTMDQYFPVVAARPAPASRGEPRRDGVVAVQLAGPATASAVVTCAIGPKRFTDLLALVYLDGRWQIISKVFHYELVPEESTTCPT
ncbi:nuclear transport factor 2 family protein [Micromonospora sp. KC721]|uniref:nuclear transport factor 2 family protein n=1 Tax=Micromonospora sp. KC721 TaxID=2530380 RepID=UPI00104A40CB|nr:nuclear transport factor 2 family protein [Micromonospora sp. KC721]TDB80421.1 nuclear transport factor 2 family protein [Micromonospora sp. KC721]